MQSPPRGKSLLDRVSVVLPLGHCTWTHSGSTVYKNQALSTQHRRRLCNHIPSSWPRGCYGWRMRLSWRRYDLWHVGCVPILTWGITFFSTGNLDVLPDLQPPTIKVQQDIFNVNKGEWLSQILLVGPWTTKQIPSGEGEWWGGGGDGGKRKARVAQ